MCDFNSLPPEMILAIFSFLDTHSLCQASQTCKDWYDFIYNSDLLWKGKCYSLNQEDIKQDIESGLWWRSIFIRNYGTNLVKKRWLEGRYSQTKALDELPSDINHLGPECRHMGIYSGYGSKPKYIMQIGSHWRLVLLLKISYLY